MPLDGARWNALREMSNEELRAAYRASLDERHRLDPSTMPADLIDANLGAFDTLVKNARSRHGLIGFVQASEMVVRRKRERLATRQDADDPSGAADTMTADRQDYGKAA